MEDDERSPEEFEDRSIFGDKALVRFCTFGSLVAVIGYGTFCFYQDIQNHRRANQPSPCENQTYTIVPSEVKNICGNIIGYNGMVSEKSISIYSAVHRGDIFYPAHAKSFEIHYPNCKIHNFRIDEVTPERLILTYLGYKK